MITGVVFGVIIALVICMLTVWLDAKFDAGCLFLFLVIIWIFAGIAFVKCGGM